MRFVFSAAGFIATSTSGWSPGVRMSWSAKWIWKPETPGSEPAGARISAGKSGSVDRSFPNAAVSLVNRLPVSCMPSPESPAKRIVTCSTCWTLFATVRLGIAHDAATPASLDDLPAAILLAVFVLPAPWGIVAVACAAVWEIAQTFGTIWWSQRRRRWWAARRSSAQTRAWSSAAAQPGRSAIRGEIWNARCEEGAEAGETVRVQGLEGLTLRVARKEAAVSEPQSHQRQ